MRTLSLAVALLAAACGSAYQPVEGAPPVDEAPDSAPATPPVEPGPDAAPSGPDAAPSPAPDAAPSSPAADAAPDRLALAPDGGADSAPLGVSPDAGADARDGATTAADGGPSAADAAPGIAPVCDTDATPCPSVRRHDDAIRATFTQPCTEGARICGSVRLDGVVVTDPMICSGGIWRLAGAWTSSTWSPFFECSRGCGLAGATCAP